MIFLVVFIKLLVFYIIFNINLVFLQFLLTFVFLLLCVAFYTLWERKILGAMQRRRGPNFEGIFGSFQPILDALKLLFREIIIPSGSNFILFVLSPMIIFFCSSLPWSLIPFNMYSVYVDVELGVMLLFALSSLVALGVILSGWSSNSKYSFLGSARAVAQLISYEVVIGLVLLPIIITSNTLNITNIVYNQIYIWNFVPHFFSFVLFFFCVLAETNRSPFDLPEAESELVSGFNVEYSGVTFVLFFLSEYFSMILMSTLVVVFFFGGWFFFNFYIDIFFSFSFKLLFILFFIVWARGIMPRFRYDQLMALCWKEILPITILIIFLSIFIYAIFGFIIYIYI